MAPLAPRRARGACRGARPARRLGEARARGVRRDACPRTRSPSRAHARRSRSTSRCTTSCSRRTRDDRVRRGRREEGRRLRRDRRPAGGVRRGARVRHAARRDHRSSASRRARRTSASCRCPRSSTSPTSTTPMTRSAARRARCSSSSTASSGTRWSCASPGSPTRRASAATSTTTTASARCATSPALVLAAPARGDDAVRMLRGAVAWPPRTAAWSSSSSRSRSTREGPPRRWRRRLAHRLPARRPSCSCRARSGLHGERGRRRLLLVSYANGLRLCLRAARASPTSTACARACSTCAGSTRCRSRRSARTPAGLAPSLVVDECRATGGGVADAIIADLAEHGVAKRLGSVRAADSYVPLGPATAAVLVGDDEIVAAAVAAVGKRRRAAARS